MTARTITSLVAMTALAAGVLAGPAHAPGADAAPPARASAPAQVTFTLAEGTDAAGTVRASVRCGGRLAAVGALHPTHRPTITRPLAASASGHCQVHLESPTRPEHVQELQLEVRDEHTVLERHLAHTQDGQTVSKAFQPSGGQLDVQIAAAQLPADQVGTGLRVMTFNMYLGGQLNADAEPGWGEENLTQLLQFVRAEDPDVLFSVETYGAGQHLEEALNADQPQDRQFTGVQVTRPEDLGANGDNLWLFTTLDVEEVYPAINGPTVSTFHFGGARLGLPDGGHVHAFSSWLHHQDSARVAANRAAMETVFDICRTDTDAEVIAVDEYARLAMAEHILEEYLPQHVTDDAPVLIGGDFNTLSHLDWSEEHAGAPGHEGLSFDWPVTASFAGAGFIDTFRHVHPDVSRYPGRTMDTVHGYLYAPDRIDYLLTRGEQVRILGSRTHAERLPEHQGSAMDEAYPFYSDHAAVVTDLVLAGEGTGLDRQVVHEPARQEDPWPAPPVGHQVPPGALNATASDAQQSREAHLAVDGDPRTHWATEEASDGPHTLTIDMGRQRDLSAVRYIPRIDSNFGMVLRGSLQASDDGERFTDVADFEWDRYNRPSDIDLTDLSTRYLRLQVEDSVGQMAAAAQVIPYQTTPPEAVEPPEEDQAVIVAPTSMHADCSAAYTETGQWISSNLPGHDGSASRYSNEPGASANWVPEVAAGGAYEVAIWWPEHQTTTTQARYTVTSADGTSEVTIDPREHAGGWHTLGTWEFAEGTSAGVTLTVGSGYHRAAAMRLQPVEQRDP